MFDCVYINYNLSEIIKIILSVLGYYIIFKQIIMKITQFLMMYVIFSSDSM